MQKPDRAVQIVDVDRPASWPAQIRCVITSHDRDARHRGEAEAALRSALDGYGVLAYHCTRLFPHEVETLRSQGLRMLTRELVSIRIEAAVAAGLLRGEARAHAERRNVYVEGSPAGREGQVCLALGRGVFDHDPAAVTPLLAIWGGEAIRGGPGAPDALRGLGTPTIVVAQLDLSSREYSSCPWLAEVFADALEGHSARADLHWRRDIEAESIIGIWQPGDSEYDRHAKLPNVQPAVDPA